MTRHIINKDTLAQMKLGAMLVNVSRGELIDTNAVINSLKKRHLGALAIDVYEGEATVFYADHSTEIIEDDLLMRLTTFPNVMVTGHQAFFTHEALNEIATTTLENAAHFFRAEQCVNNLLKGNFVTRRSAKPIRT
jgi:D-lactate dehydrogenase